MSAIRLYGHPLSGHSHRVALFLSLLKLPYEYVTVNVMAGEHRQPPFLSKNPFGQIPVIEDGDVTLADSNAILVYLALRYDASGRWYPREPVAAALVQRWLSVAAGELCSGPGRARLIKLFGAKLDYELAASIANRLLGLLDAHLASRQFLVGEAPTLADVAIYTYTALAPEGGISLEPYAGVRAWLARVEALDGFVPMQQSGPSA